MKHGCLSISRIKKPACSTWYFSDTTGYTKQEVEWRYTFAVTSQMKHNAKVNQPIWRNHVGFASMRTALSNWLEDYTGSHRL
ncbi:hypothetical protein Smp_132290 [Schistosoma mansoni]|uniref:hypothetical protein n=1 Tax=Schistosoma mansoni TaxID=6183 RepID=UPI0001A63CF2|nr:hypothetical protein Smp_132290 [Schistosoma mansoni]|eukprot:XP_018650772.1 hypothetical protein Smp_132290 [Schistosoma mansoni]